MDRKEELVKQLISKTDQKSRGFKLFIWGIVLGVLNVICYPLIIDKRWFGRTRKNHPYFLGKQLFYFINTLIAFVNCCANFVTLWFVKMIKCSWWNWKN